MSFNPWAAGNVFLASIVVDICWARYVTEVALKQKLHASVWAAALYLVGAVPVIAYTADNRMIFPAALGAFVGTYLGVRR